MEKENARLKANQEEATVKRIKLDYDNIGSCARENMEVFETILNDKSGRKYDREMLMQAIRQGKEYASVIIKTMTACADKALWFLGGTFS